MDTKTLESTQLVLLDWRNRTCVACRLVGEVGLRKRRLPSGRVWPGAGKKSTRAPTRGVVEGVSWPHIVAFWGGFLVVVV